MKSVENELEKAKVRFDATRKEAFGWENLEKIMERKIRNGRDH